MKILPTIDPEWNPPAAPAIRIRNLPFGQFVAFARVDSANGRFDSRPLREFSFVEDEFQEFFCHNSKMANKRVDATAFKRWEVAGCRPAAHHPRRSLKNLRDAGSALTSRQPPDPKMSTAEPTSQRTMEGSEIL